VNVLFLAYYFPPDLSSGSFRPFFFANHLSESGVGVHVLTANGEDFLLEQSLDSLFLDQYLLETSDHYLRLYNL